MSHKRLRIVVAVLFLVVAFMGLLGDAYASSSSSIELNSTEQVTSFSKWGGGGGIIMGGCEESASGCPG